MIDIKFTRNYGLAPAAPFWLVWNEDGFAPNFKHPNLESAENEAARLAASIPGARFMVLGVLSAISTSTEIVGTKFDPLRNPPEPDVKAYVSPEPVAPLPPAPVMTDNTADLEPF